MEQAVFGGGCFWCIEAIIQRLKGVEKVISGYTNGDSSERPTYREICSGLSGFAEVIEVTFNTEIISYHDLITIFMTSHDPTTLNRQDYDKGTQYRSAIFYSNESQKKIAEQVKTELKNYFNDPIVTEVEALETFYVADSSHQDYYNQNKEAGYCRAIIDPKIAKLRTKYAHFLKE